MEKYKEVMGTEECDGRKGRRRDGRTIYQEGEGKLSV